MDVAFNLGITLVCYHSQEDVLFCDSEATMRLWHLPQEPLASSARHGWYIWRSLNGPKWDPGVRASFDHLAPLWSGPQVFVQTQPTASPLLMGRMLKEPGNCSQSHTLLNQFLESFNIPSVKKWNNSVLICSVLTWEHFYVWNAAAVRSNHTTFVYLLPWSFQVTSWTRTWSTILAWGSRSLPLTTSYRKPSEPTCIATPCLVSTIKR